MNKITLLSWLLVFIFTSVFLNAQNDYTDTAEYSTGNNEQYLIDLFYPLYISEITTNDGLVYRGRIVGVTSHAYIIDVRVTGEHIVRRESIKEIAWAVGDRRDFNVFTGVGINAGFLRRDAIGTAPGVNISYGYEFSSSWVFQLDYMGSFFYPLGNAATTEGVALSFELLCGYRFNRNKSSIHTLAMGGGFGYMELFDSDDYFWTQPEQQEPSPLVFSLLYDYEFGIGSKTGMSIFSRFQYYNLYPSQPLILLGISFKFYNALPRTGNMLNSPVFNQDMMY